MFTVAFIAIISSITAYICYKKFDEVTLTESIGIFGISFLISVSSIVAATSYQLYDTQIISGTITSKIERDAYDYQEDYTYECNCVTKKNSDGTTYESCSTCTGTHHYHEPKTWYIAQTVYGTKKGQELTIERKFPYKGDRLDQWNVPLERCYGECNFSSSESDNHLNVSENKFNNTKIGKPTVWTEKFDNYVKQSNAVFNDYLGQIGITYPTIYDYDEVERIKGGNNSLKEKIDKLNSELSNSRINIQLYYIGEANIYEKLIRAWKGGKPNDFIIIVNGNQVDILSWNNYDIKEKIKNVIKKLPNKESDTIISALYENKNILSGFREKNFNDYSYLNVDLSFGIIFGIIILNIFIIGVIAMIFLNNNYGKGDEGNYSNY